MEKEVVLSISLLASDRKETIRKCLDSLKPIMEKVKSELIIVDTGCGEEVRGILEEYTEKIIPFTWCKDFSKARNAGLEQAKGEWFLYIDDDEWFSDVTEIVNFFTSGEYKRFGMANYIQRNYLDKKKTEYSDSWVSRMVKLDKDTHFESSIHEYFTPIRGNVKLLHSAVEHFGYIFQSEKEKYEHSKRNVSLLLEMLEKEPDNIRWYTQLVQEYRGIREYKQLYELCKTALLRFEKIDVSEINKDRGCFYTGKLLVDMYTYDIEQAEKDFKESIADIRNTDCCRIALYYYGAEIAFLQKQYEKCETYSKNYLELYEKVKDDEVRQMLEGAFCVRDMLEERALNSIYSFIIECGLKKNSTSYLKKYFDKIVWQTKTLYVYGSLVPDIVKAMSELEFESEFIHFAQTFLNRKGPDKEAVDYIKKTETENETAFWKLARIFSETKSNYYYIHYLKILYAGKTKDKEQIKKSFAELFDCVLDLLQLDDKVWEIAEENEIDLDELFLSLPFDRFKKGVDSFCENTSLEQLAKRGEMMKQLKKNENIRYSYFFLKEEEAKLVYGADRDNYKALRERLYHYANESMAFYGNYYKETAFLGDMEMLPANVKTAAVLAEFFSLEDDFRKALSCLKKAIGVFPSLDASLKSFARLYGEEQKKLAEQKKQKEQNLTELESLVLALKEKAEWLLAEGKREEAEQILSEIKPYLTEGADE